MEESLFGAAAPTPVDIELEDMGPSQGARSWSESQAADAEEAERAAEKFRWRGRREVVLAVCCTNTDPVCETGVDLPRCCWWLAGAVTLLVVYWTECVDVYGGPFFCPEPVVPDVSLTRSRDGSTGVATFTFDNPSFLAASSESLGETTGMYLKDSEGTMKTSEVTATFTNGKPRFVKGVVVMKSTDEWDRFMRFMERCECLRPYEPPSSVPPIDPRPWAHH